MGTQHDHLVNVGLYTATGAVTGAAEGDLWYNSTEGQVKLALDDDRVTTAGPFGTHPMVYSTANAWYPIMPGGAVHASLTTTNNRAYAYPLYPGRKCNFTGIAIEVLTAGTGNARMMVYEASVATGLPETLLDDHFDVDVSTTGVKTGWLLDMDLMPRPYWLVFVSKTSAAPVLATYRTNSAKVPYIGATPTFASPGIDATVGFYNCLYSDTGFSGPTPGTFGAIAGSTLGPAIKVKLSQ